MKKIEDYIRSIPDFPEPGIIFRDITSVLQDADGLQLAIDSMQDCLKDAEVDVIAGTESRGFIFGVPIAYNLHNRLFRFVSRGNCRVRRCPRAMIWSMEVLQLRCIRIPSNQVRRLQS